MKVVEYLKSDLKEHQIPHLDVNLDFLVDEFSRWIVEYVAQQSPLIMEI